MINQRGRLIRAIDLLPSEARFRIRGHAHDFHIYTHMTRLERLLLYKLSLSLARGNYMVEIGSYLGASSCFLAAGAGENGGRLYCVDTWQNDAMTEGPRDTYTEFLQNTSSYKDLIIPVRKRSHEAAMHFSKTIDLLFVDGDHSYEAVVRDLKSWLPQLRPGGWLIMHDSWSKEGVKRAIEEIVMPLQMQRPWILPNMYAVCVQWNREK